MDDFAIFGEHLNFSQIIKVFQIDNLEIIERSKIFLNLFRDMVQCPIRLIDNQRHTRFFIR